MSHCAAPFISKTNVITKSCLSTSPVIYQNQKSEKEMADAVMQRYYMTIDEFFNVVNTTTKSNEPEKMKDNKIEKDFSSISIKEYNKLIANQRSKIRDSQKHKSAENNRKQFIKKSNSLENKYGEKRLQASRDNDVRRSPVPPLIQLPLTSSTVSRSGGNNSIDRIGYIVGTSKKSGVEASTYIENHENRYGNKKTVLSLQSMNTNYVTDNVQDDDSNDYHQDLNSRKCFYGQDRLSSPTQKRSIQSTPDIKKAKSNTFPVLSSNHSWSSTTSSSSKQSNKSHENDQAFIDRDEEDFEIEIVNDDSDFSSTSEEFNISTKPMINSSSDGQPEHKSVEGGKPGETELIKKKRVGGKLGRKRRRGYIYDPKPLISKNKATRVPTETKDPEYWDKRLRNNEAAKRSRENRRQKELEIIDRANNLDSQNESLKKRIIELEEKNAYLECLLSNKTSTQSTASMSDGNIRKCP